MDVGVITDEISQDITEALEVMKRCDITIGEIRGVWGKNSIDLDPDEVGRLKSILDREGVSVCAVASPFYKCDLFEGDKAERGRLHDAADLGLAEQMDVLRKACDLAETLNTDSIRVFSFWRTSDPTPEIEDRIVEMFQEPARYAASRGMKLLLENEYSCFLGTGVETARVLKRLDNSVIQAVWDPGNAFCGGEVPYPDGYEALKPWTTHIHIKDAVRESDGSVRFCKVGEGELKYAEHISRLKQDGYDGVLSLETHYSKDPGGKAAASEESLLAMAAMVRGA